MTLHDLSKLGSAEAVESYLNAVFAQSPDDLSYVLDLRNDQRYTALHCAIFARYFHLLAFQMKKTSHTYNFVNTEIFLHSMSWLLEVPMWTSSATEQHLSFWRWQLQCSRKENNLRLMRYLSC